MDKCTKKRHFYICHQYIDSVSSKNKRRGTTDETETNDQWATMLTQRPDAC